MIDAAVKHGRWTVAAALAALEGAQKPPQGTPAYSRFVNRPIGRQLAARAVRLGLTPNQVSGLSGLCSLVALVLLATTPATPVVALAVAAALVLGYALDSADGQVARLTGLGSPFGEWLDHMIDCAKGVGLHLAVAIHVFRFTELPAGWLLVPLAYCLVDTLVFFGMTLTDQLRRAHGHTARSQGGSLSLTRSVLLLPSDFGVLCLVFLTLAWTPVFIGLYSLMCAAYAALLLAALVRWSRVLRTFERRA